MTSFGGESTQFGVEESYSCPFNLFPFIGSSPAIPVAAICFILKNIYLDKKCVLIRFAVVKFQFEYATTGNIGSLLLLSVSLFPDDCILLQYSLIPVPWPQESLIWVLCSRNFLKNCSHFAYRGASNFTQALVAWSYTVFKVPNKHRRGWQVNLRGHPQRELSIPWLISLNARSLPNTTDDFHNTRMILVLELWHNNFIDRELLNIFLFWLW